MMDEKNFPFWGDRTEDLVRESQQRDETIAWAEKFITEHANEGSKHKTEPIPVRKALTFNQVIQVHRSK